MLLKKHEKVSNVNIDTLDAVKETLSKTTSERYMQTLDAVDRGNM